MKQLSRQEIERVLNSCVGEWEAEDASQLIDILLEAFTLDQAYSWLFFHQAGMGVPLFMLEAGHHREVFKAARERVAQVTSAS